MARHLLRGPKNCAVGPLKCQRARVGDEQLCVGMAKGVARPEDLAGRGFGHDVAVTLEKGRGTRT